jgi:hypothetical protein
VIVADKLYFTSIGRAIFSRIWEDERQLQEIVNFKQACVPIGRAIFN